jgi:hypothetical protein
MVELPGGKILLEFNAVIPMGTWLNLLSTTIIPMVLFTRYNGHHYELLYIHQFPDHSSTRSSLNAS